MDLREKITDAVYDHPGAPAIIDAVMGVVEAEIKELREENSRLRVLEAASRTIRAERAEKDQKIIERGKRIRALEDENQRMRDEIAARIVEEERSVQEQIVEEPLNTWLAGLLFGLQRARDIVTSPAREIAEEEA